MLERIFLIRQKRDIDLAWIEGIMTTEEYSKTLLQIAKALRRYAYEIIKDERNSC